MPVAQPLEICEADRSTWNNQPCTNLADVIIGGVAICAECANRLLKPASATAPRSAGSAS